MIHAAISSSSSKWSKEGKSCNISAALPHMSARGSEADVLASQSGVSSGSHGRHGSPGRQDEECLLTPSLSFGDCGNRLICPPRQIKSGHLAAANQRDGQIASDFQKSCQAPFAKIFCFAPDANQSTDLRRPAHRGACARHERGAGCGGRGGVRRAIVSRTNGADAYGEVVWF
jgi:hypothetical protein